MKKLLHFQKTRDAVIAIAPQQASDPNLTPTKHAEAAASTGKCRSIFYTFLLRCVSQLLKDDNTDEKLLRFLRTTQGDVFTQMKELNLPTSPATVTLFMKSKAI